MTRETWPQYIARVAVGMSQKEIAAAAGIDSSGVSRWRSGENMPRAENVIAFAQSIGREPVEALVAAGYLTPDQAHAVVIEVHRSQLVDFSDDEVFGELRRRMIERGGGNLSGDSRLQ